MSNMTKTEAQAITVHAHGETTVVKTTRQVTHALTCINRDGEAVVALTRVPDKAAKDAARYGCTEIHTIPIVDGVAK